MGIAYESLLNVHICGVFSGLSTSSKYSNGLSSPSEICSEAVHYMGFSHNREYVESYPGGFKPNSIVTKLLLYPSTPFEDYRDVYFKQYVMVDTHRGMFYNNSLDGGNDWYNGFIKNVEPNGCLFLTNITTEDVKRCAKDALNLSYGDMWFCSDWDESLL